jgi:hypothetical protein
MPAWIRRVMEYDAARGPWGKIVVYIMRKSIDFIAQVGEWDFYSFLLLATLTLSMSAKGWPHSSILLLICEAILTKTSVFLASLALSVEELFVTEGISSPNSASLETNA